MYKRIVSAAAVTLMLSACSQQSLTLVQTDTTTVCGLVGTAQAVDPALAIHNPKAVALGAKVCAAAPGVLALVPVTSATVPAPAS